MYEEARGQPVSVGLGRQSQLPQMVGTQIARIWASIRANVECADLGRVTTPREVIRACRQSLSAGSLRVRVS
jgi:hypothetical protein